MKKVLMSLVSIIAIATLLVSCGEGGATPIKTKSRTLTTKYFDTVSVIGDYSGDSDAEFNRRCAEIEDILAKYYELFDIYHTYPSIVNLANVNAMAGKGPVAVSEELIDFLEYTKEMYTLTGGYVNVAMGAVLSLWHDEREYAEAYPDRAKLPDATALALAAEHCDINTIVIDRANMTVEITDPLASIDVGAIGKGYAVERVAEYLEADGAFGYTLDVGGNLRVIGTKPDGTQWRTGVKNPLTPGSYSYIFYLSDGSAVTSGGYERNYVVDGVRYNHIIDKDTMMPAEHFASVSIICRDSALADSLSTALFCMDHDMGLALVESIGDVRVIWVYNDGTVVKSFD